MSPKSTPECGFEYSRAGPKDWRAAAQVWFGPAATTHQLETFLLTTQQDDILARGWWVARRGEEVAAVQLVLPQPGAMAVCWPPMCRAGQQQHFKPLWVQARQAALDQGVHLFQCLVPTNDLVSVELMTALGFRRITELITMRYRQDVRRSDAELSDVTSLEVVEVSTDAEPAFAGALFETYVESRDVPEMDRYQRREDILAGYAAPPARRWLLRDGHGTEVGALVLTEHEGVGQLNYLGIIRQARRRGLGRLAVAWTLSHFRSHDVGQVTVRLDARNEPALRLYESCGFLEAHRDALLVAK